MDRFGLAHRISRKQDRLLDRLRDRRTDAAAGLPGTADSFAALIGEEFALLVTFRRSGAAVPTPVWFGMYDGRLYVESLADAGKVKRLRQDRRVRVAPCTVRGKPKGSFVDGVGRILEAAEEQNAELALDRHYGLRRRLYVRLGARLVPQGGLASRPVHGSLHQIDQAMSCVPGGLRSPGPCRLRRA